MILTKNSKGSHRRRFFQLKLYSFSSHFRIWFFFSKFNKESLIWSSRTDCTIHHKLTSSKKTFFVKIIKFIFIFILVLDSYEFSLFIWNLKPNFSRRFLTYSTKSLTVSEPRRGRHFFDKPPENWMLFWQKNHSKMSKSHFLSKHELFMLGSWNLYGEWARPWDHFLCYYFYLLVLHCMISQNRIFEKWFYKGNLHMRMLRVHGRLWICAFLSLIRFFANVIISAFFKKSFL